MLTYGDARRILAKYAGVGGLCDDPENPEINLFVREVLQYLLYSSAYQDLRRFDFCAAKGVFTVPEEVESIQKVKINGLVGAVWDKWFSYHSANYLDGDCIPPNNAILEDPNEYPCAYDVPQSGTNIGIVGRCDEASDAHVIIQGQDNTGREIFTVHKGEQIAGEYLSIRKNMMMVSTVKFAKITNVIKTKTKGYATLYWVNGSQKGFLSDYTPLEERPSYRRYRLTTPDCGPYVNVSVLARIRLKNAYADIDKIPFDNIMAIKTAGQMANANFNNDMQSAVAKSQLVDSVIAREQNHKRVNTGTPVNIWGGTAAGRIRNIVGPGFGGLFSGMWGKK